MRYPSVRLPRGSGNRPYCIIDGAVELYRGDFFDRMAASAGLVDLVEHRDYCRAVVGGDGLVRLQDSWVLGIGRDAAAEADAAGDVALLLVNHAAGLERGCQVAV